MTYFTGSITSQGLSLLPFLICTAVSLILGIANAYMYMIKNSYSRSFVVTLATLPAMVQIIIMLVNGNLGTGVAVMGAFSLVRFRSAPGNAREIGSIFLSMAIGLATGMGYLVYALLFFIFISAANTILWVKGFGESKDNMRQLRITMPEDIDYNGILDDLFEKYTDEVRLIRVRTTNIGSLFELTYGVRMKSRGIPKEFIDEIRCRNGNLNIIVGEMNNSTEEL